MPYQELYESNKDYENENDDINYDEIANSMLGKMDKHMYEESSVFPDYSENIDKNTSTNLNEETNATNKSTLLRNEKFSNQENGIDKHTLHATLYPRRVMTPLGPLPLPEEFKRNIPEKFVAKPIIEEREIYVSKKERKQREIEVPHVKYEHTFEKIKKQLKVSKLVPSVSQVIKEVPKEVLKPVIEEKIIEVPQGVKYVEVPVEVPCLYPPKIIPKVVTQYVERIVETIKPVVQEKIIEVPQTVIKQVPKIKTVEVPYYVPRYVEKIVEVPFKPNGEMPQLGTHSPFSISESLPPLKPTHFLNNHQNPYDQFNMHHSMYPQMNDYNKSFEQNIMNSTSPIIPNLSMPPTILKSMNSKESFSNTPINFPMNSSSILNSNGDCINQENLYSQIENLPYKHKLPEGLQWQYSDGVMNKPLMNNRNMPPLVVTCPPEIGRVTCARKDIQPDILTKTGVYEFDGFKKKGTSQSLFPPLAHHSRVPFLPPPAAPGTPDVRTIENNRY
ncbi:inner membrane complex protein 1h, putative [Plasmodium gallinaceum]|uniref:Inner membrane complex protein 1h, putative n=1 Tax=Plasmodium gallinaceum TaxID=5849 RepID=A0A1J1H006_PLAGA|nr:inner membrane complex protein 1h, putative [Plasmodium gallinaceum]CRG97777.1 inner membrane complex protein 1h, putative [Plasmodium gallinaceum]